jgi:uncharacterized protein (TIGR03067 family)
MRKALALGLCAALTWAVGTSTAEEKKFDAAKLSGKWTIVSGMKSGEKVPEGNLKNQKVEIDKDKLTMTGGDMKFVMELKLDTAKNPVAVKITIKEGLGEGTTTDGIIELDGDTLKLCYALPNEKAPTDFTAKEKSGHHLFVMKRAK